MNLLPDREWYRKTLKSTASLEKRSTRGLWGWPDEGEDGSKLKKGGRASQGARRCFRSDMRNVKKTVIN